MIKKKLTTGIVLALLCACSQHNVKTSKKKVNDKKPEAAVQKKSVIKKDSLKLDHPVYTNAFLTKRKDIVQYEHGYQAVVSRHAFQPPEKAKSHQQKANAINEVSVLKSLQQKSLAIALAKGQQHKKPKNNKDILNAWLAYCLGNHLTDHEQTVVDNNPMPDILNDKCSPQK